MKKGWTETTFGDAAEFTGKPRGINYAQYDRIPFLPMERVSEGGGEPSEYDWRPGASIRSGNYFEKGDCLLAKITPCFENGKQAVTNELPADFGVASTELIPFRGKAGISSKYFLYYVLLDTKARRQLAQKMEGATGRQRIPMSVLREWPILLPPLSEQERIAGILMKIQGAIRLQDRIIQILRDLKKSTLRHLFTHGTRGEKTKMTEIGEMPESWEVVKLGEVFETQLGKMLSQKARVGDDPRPYLRNKNVQWGRIDLSDMLCMDFSERERRKFLLRPGDLLICEGGEPGRAAIWSGDIKECYYQKALHRLRPKDERGSNCFLALWLTYAFQSQNLYGIAGASSTIAHLPEIQLKQLPIPIAPAVEQYEITRVLNDLSSRVMAHENRKSLYQDMFSSTLGFLYAEGGGW